MRKIIGLSLSLFAAAAFGAYAFGAEDIEIYVNGEIVESEIKPVIEDGNTLIPIRPVTEAMGCNVEWVEEEKGIKIESGEMTVRMQIGSELIYINTADNLDVVQTLSVVPKIINGSAYIPMRPMAEALGAAVSWEGETKKIYIEYDEENTENSYEAHDGIGRINANDEDEGVYIGDLENGTAEGKGTMTWENGDKYEGEFKAGYMEGYGVYTFADGSSYEGEFKANEFSGYGTYTFSDGTVYEGEFENDTMNGTGTITYPNGDIYEGQTVNGTIEGTGKFTFADGSVYEGEFSEGNINGKGRATYADGTVLEGIWENGVLVS